MHEIIVTRNLLDLVVSECKGKNIQMPGKIIALLGGLTSYKKEPVLYYFEIMKADFPILKNTTLDIIEVEGKLYCNSCKKESTIEDIHMIFCPLCDSFDVKITQGKDFLIREIIANDEHEKNQSQQVS